MNEQRADQPGWEAELFRLLVENSTDYAVFLVDPEGRVQTWNRGAERVLGYAEAEIVGRSSFVTFTPEDRDDIKLLKSARDGLVTGIVLTSNAKALIDRKGDGPEPTMQMALVDDAGLLEFSDRPETAPIVHFNGPLRMGLHPMQKLIHGQESNLAVGIGTPGLGKGTFAMRGYQGVPADAQPVVDIEFAHKDIKAAPIKLRVTLKERC